MKYVIKTGESLTLDLMVSADSQGAMNSVTEISAVLKRPAGSGSVPPAGTPVLATFNVSEIEGGWSFTLHPSQTALLAPGLYITDARIKMGDDVRITDPVQVEVRGSVS